MKAKLNSPLKCTNEQLLILTEVLVDVAEEHHDEADGEEVDGEERRQRPARQAPRVQQLPHRIVVVVDICGIGEREMSLKMKSAPILSVNCSPL